MKQAAYIPHIPSSIPIKNQKGYEENPVVGQCEECGREIRKLEYYTCVEDNCPIKPSVTLN